MLSQVVGWIELDEAARPDVGWQGLLTGGSVPQHRFAGSRSRLTAFSDSCSAECIAADVEQLQADLQAEFDALRRLAR